MDSRVNRPSTEPGKDPNDSRQARASGDVAPGRAHPSPPSRTLMDLQPEQDSEPLKDLGDHAFWSLCLEGNTANPPIEALHLI